MDAAAILPHALAAERFEQEVIRDPLAWWNWGLQGAGLDRLRQALALFTDADPIDELHLRACNKGTKTTIKARFVTACLQKRPLLAGVKIPQWPGRVTGMQLVLDYPQQLLSVKEAYLAALGRWPHHPHKNGDHLTSIAVMPVGGDPQNEADWSVLYFMSMKNMQAGTGARADVIDFDEPPPMDFLHELRKAGHANRRGIILIGETPIKRRQWAPLRADYGDQPRRSLRRIDYRAEVRWSLDEVADFVLSPADKEKLRAKYSTDPHKGAREHGDYVNVEGACPFDEATIMQMIAAWCQPPKLRRIQVAIEDTHGEPKEVESIAVEWWESPEGHPECYQAIDPASGIDDGAHNPAGLQLGCETSGNLLVRWNGYLAPYSVGALAAATHRHYSGAATDIEMMDSWGINVERGYRENGGTNLCYSTRELRRDLQAKETGYRVTAETRAIWIGCIQEWIAAFKASMTFDENKKPIPGPGAFAICRSRAVFECLLDMELDEKDKPVAGPGVAHAEDFVLLGQRLRRYLAHRDVRTDPGVYVPGPTEAERQFRNIFGDERPRRTARLVPLNGRPA